MQYKFTNTTELFWESSEAVPGNNLPPCIKVNEMSYKHTFLIKV